MIDTRTGTLTLSTTGESLGPRLTRTDFLRSRLGQSAVAGSARGASIDYEAKLAAGEIGPNPFHLSLRFDGDRLVAIHLSDDSPELGLWTTHGEVARKASHDDWLRKQGVAVGTYDWGKLISELDDGARGSYVAFVYRVTAPQ